MALTHCKQCGKQHEEIDTQIAFGKPDAYFEVPEAEREKRVFLTTDICDIDGERLFVRGVLQIPVHGHEHFAWGIWVEMGSADFDRSVALYESSNQANEPPLHGHIATAIPVYRKSSLGVPVGVQLTGPTTRPLSLCPESRNFPSPGYFFTSCICRRIEEREPVPAFSHLSISILDLLSSNLSANSIERFGLYLHSG